MKKRLHGGRLVLFSVLSTLAGCRERPSHADAGATLRPVPVDAGPVALLLAVEVRLTDGGVFQAALEPSPTALLPVTQAVDVTANLPLHNYRIRILDELDRALASDDVPEELEGRLRYHIALSTPLRTGHRYTVLLDAQSGTTLDDGTGAVVNEQRYEFRVEGEREKDAPAKRPVKRKHRPVDGK